MKALVYEGNKTLCLKNVSDPIVRDDEVLIKIESVGICGSDMHAYLGHDERRPPPLILGHEVAGVVCSNGELTRRVTVNPLLVCRQCKMCLSGRSNLCPQRQIISMPPREGGFAEWIAMPECNLMTVPETTLMSHAALTEPIACGWHAVRIASEATKKTLSDCRCLVLGGGAIGVGAAVVLSTQGAASVDIVEQNTIRHAAIKRAGDFRLHHSADTVNEMDIDIIIDAVGIKKTREIACKKISAGGVIVHIGLGDNCDGVDVRRMTLQEITFIGVYTYTEQDFAATADAIFNKQLGSLDWLEERSLAEGSQAFKDILNGSVAATKIILKPNQ